VAREPPIATNLSGRGGSSEQGPQTEGKSLQRDPTGGVFFGRGGAAGQQGRGGYSVIPADQGPATHPWGRGQWRTGGHFEGGEVSSVKGRNLAPRAGGQFCFLGDPKGAGGGVNPSLGDGGVAPRGGGGRAGAGGSGPVQGRGGRHGCGHQGRL